MATAAVTSKGQITIPVEVREDIGLKAGDRVSFLKARTANIS
jgi:AbrB family looped-hinge helix DNA binding protein